MIENSVKLSTGHIQIHKNGYWNDKSINNTFANDESIMKKINSIEEVTTTVPRLESFALASSGNFTKGTLVIGINPSLENKLNELADKIISGEYLSENDGSAVVAEKLAEYLHVTVGDTIILLGQGYHGITAAGAYHIKGILKMPVPEMNKQLVYLSLPETQYLYATGDMVTSYSIILSSNDYLDDSIEKLKSFLDEKEYEVMPWQTMNREMVQAIEGDNAGGIIMLAILYLIIGFGIFGTVMMMTIERKKEFAVLVAIGMQRSKLAWIVFLESLIISSISVIIGIILSIPLLYYLHLNPIPLSGDLAKTLEQFGVEAILPFSIDSYFFFEQAAIVFVLSVLAALYPIFVINKFTVIKSLRD
ncbi:MAG: FtsX-like permease family protein [Melioribacteraceae bacterium]|nr:FtsX-like permease family protein [Melioribacteraceae bacterium]